LALRPQHQQHNKVSNPKVVQHQLIKKYVTRKIKHANILILLRIRASLLRRHKESTHISSYSWLSARYPRRGNIQTEGVRFHIQ